MVDPALQSVVEAMSLDERLELVEYIESTVDHAPVDDRGAEGHDPDASRAVAGRPVDRPDMGRARRSDRVALDVTPRHLVFHPGLVEDLESVVAYYADRDPALSATPNHRLVALSRR